MRPLLKPLLYLFVVGFPSFVNAATKKPQPVISRITIRNTDIFDFDTNVSLKKFPYTAINALHIKTREHVIRRELLFKVGDRFDPYLASETERNLRALSFIRAARVAKFPQRDGTIALVVHVNDSWTTEPQINLGGQNKISSKEVGFKEKNLFGFGKTVGVFYKEGDGFIQREYSYDDPRFLGSRWQLDGKFLSRTEGEERTASLVRPFYSADTKWSAGTSHNRSEAVLDEFINNQKVSRFKQTKEINEVFAALKVGGGREYVNHTGLRYRKSIRAYERNSETALGRGIPENDDLRTIFLDMDVSHNNYLEMIHLEKMTRVEDINLGPTLRVSPGFSPKSLNGGENKTEGEAVFERRNLLKNEHLFYRRYSYSGRNPLDQSENQRYQAQLKLYYRQSDKSTLVLNTRADWGDRLDPDNQVKLGGENGLRAFKIDNIVGTKGWVFNAEERFYLIDELWSLVSVGAVTFFDTGYVWARSQPVALSKLRSDIGAGLRFGLTRSSNEVILRLDFAYRLQVDNPGDSHLVVTFGTGQAF